MNAHLRARLADLKQHLGPMFYRIAIPGGLLTIWPTADGWQPIGIPDREQPKGELRMVPKDGSDSHFTYRFHYPDDGAATAGAWEHLIAEASDG